jgi:hypothetical protein
MSKKEFTICDVCKKESRDRYESFGWIHFESSAFVQITVSKGRKKDGTAKTGYCQNEELDFCSLPCLVEKIRKL